MGGGGGVVHQHFTLYIIVFKDVMYLTSGELQNYKLLYYKSGTTYYNARSSPSF